MFLNFILQILIAYLTYFGCMTSILFLTDYCRMTMFLFHLQNSELEAWEDEANAWDVPEASEDLTWQVEEAMKENRRKERMERHEEQQKRRMKKDEMRGTKSGSLIATRLS